MNNNKSVFNNFSKHTKSYVKQGTRVNGPFMNEFGEDIISEVVQNEIKVKPKKNKNNYNSKEQNNSSTN